MFLDIACFFVGRNKEYVAKILDGRGFFPEDGFVLLFNKSLITINCANEIGMHDLLRDMGRGIIREMSPEHLGKRSRIWFHEDARDLLNKKMGTKMVEGVALDVRALEVVSLSTESFTNMRRLKLLQINGVHLTGSFKEFSKELIWLCWFKCPLKCLPSDFTLDNLVVLDMQYSNIKELWKEKKILNKLKILDLSYSKHLVKVPNLHSSSLEKLMLEGCSSIVEVHQCIGNLKSLVLLNLEGCCRLKNLPESMGDLKSLETLNVKMCSELKSLPECLGDMESLRELLANGIAIQELPSSIGNLKGLISLSLEGCWGPKILPDSICDVKTLQNLNISGCLQLEKLPDCMGDMESLTELLADGIQNQQFFSSIGHLKHVRKLSLRGYSFNQESSSSTSWLSPRGLNLKAFLSTSLTRWRLLRELQLGYCGLSEGALSCVDFGSLSFLEELDLSGNKFFNLPAGVGSLPKLGILKVQNCRNLISISELPSSLITLGASNCTSLKRVRLPIQSKIAPALYLYGCQNLTEIQGAESAGNGFNIFSESCYSLSNNCKLSLVEAFCKCGNGYVNEVQFSGGEMPNWFSYRGEGCSTLSFRLPRVFHGLTFWVVYESSPDLLKGWVIIRDKSKDIQLFEYHIGPSIGDNMCWVSYIRFREEEIEGFCGQELELFVIVSDPETEEIKVKECGVHVMVENSEWNPDIDNQGRASSTETDMVISEQYHYRLHHPSLGSFATSTLKQWKNFFLRELPPRYITNASIYRNPKSPIQP